MYLFFFFFLLFFLINFKIIVRQYNKIIHCSNQYTCLVNRRGLEADEVNTNKIERTKIFRII